MSVAPRRLTLNTPILVANPSAPTVTGHGTPGSTSRAYKIVGLDANGSPTAASSAGTDASGPDALNGTDFERITWTDPLGAVNVQVWRATPSGVKGLIGTVAAGVQTLDDTGQTVTTAGDPPSSNVTGIGTQNSVAGASHASAWVTGTFTATVQIQTTPDGGTTWVNTGSALTAAGYVDLPSCNGVRAKMTAYTSGTPQALVLYAPGG